MAHATEEVQLAASTEVSSALEQAALSEKQCLAWLDDWFRAGPAHSSPSSPMRPADAAPPTAPGSCGAGLLNPAAAEFFMPVNTEADEETKPFTTMPNDLEKSFFVSEAEKVC